MQKSTKVTKHWRISRILKEIPDSVELFLEYDLDCFSCDASDTERLNQGLESHGYTEIQINEFVDRLQQMIDKIQQIKLTPVSAKDKVLEITNSGTKIAGLSFTPQAIQAISDLNQESDKFFCIKVTAGGCSGYSYEYNYFQIQPENTELFKLTESIELALDLYSYHKLKGSTVDFKFALKDSGLKILNPNTKTACHCGKSIGF